MLDLSQTELGFEIEFGSDLKHHKVIESISGIFDEKWMSPYQRRLKRNKRKQKDYFSLARDMSIVPLYIDYIEYELITPVWKFEDSIPNLFKIFEFMDDIYAEVNETTGLHVNIGFIEPKIFNELKVVILCDEDKWLKKFKRENNDFCTSHIKSLSKYFRDFKVEEFEEYKKMLEYNLNTLERRMAINFNHSNYVEFRMIGNSDYHKKLNLVEESIRHFCWSLVMGANDDDSLLMEKLKEDYKSTACVS